MKYFYNGVSLQNNRQINMDSLLLKSRRIGDKDAMLAVVCDGVGSLADGGYASGTAVRLLNEWFGGETLTARAGIRIRDIILDINAYVIKEAANHNIDTASTLSALFLVDDYFYIAHIGDSRIYSYGDGLLKVLTNDDVSESGELTAYLGKRADIFMQCYEGAAPGKIFMVCSDGLYKKMDAGQIIEKMLDWDKRPHDAPVNSLARYVIERGERDNITLALIKATD